MIDYSDMPAVATAPKEETTGDARMNEVVVATRAGVQLEVALSGVGVSLAEFSELIEAMPGLQARLRRGRLDFIIELKAKMMDAAGQGKHLAAQALLADVKPMGREIDEALMGAGDGDVGAMSDGDVEDELSRIFSEE